MRVGVGVGLVQVFIPRHRFQYVHLGSTCGRGKGGGWCEKMVRLVNIGVRLLRMKDFSIL